MAKRWYVVHAYSGYEKHVMRSLIERVKLAGMEEEFGEILVPTEEVVEMRNGQKRKSEPANQRMRGYCAGDVVRQRLEPFLSARKATPAPGVELAATATGNVPC